MPDVRKQVARPARAGSNGTAEKPGKVSSAWDLAVDVGPDGDGIKLNVYGGTKTGKTRLACSFPKPMLLIGTEKGTKSVSNVKGVKFAPIKTVAQFLELVREVPTATGAMMPAGFEKNVGYASVGLDTAGGFQAGIVLKEVIGIDEVPETKNWTFGVVTQEQWGVINSQWIEHMSKLLGLAEQGIHVVVIAHERVFKGKDSGRESDVIQPQAGSALTPGACGWLNGACDYICQTYIRRDFVFKETKSGVGKDLKIIRTKSFTGKMQYCLRIGPDENYMTGFRVPEGVNLPDSLILGKTGEPAKVSPHEQIAALIAGKSLKIG